MILNQQSVLSVLVLSSLLYFASAHLLIAEENQMTTIYLQNGLNELSKNEKQMGLQLLSNELIKDSGMTMVVKPVNTFEKIQQLIKAGEIDYAILNSFHYLKHFDYLHQVANKSLWTIQRGPNSTEKYIIVANKDLKNKTIGQLSGASLSFYPHYLLMNFYLDFTIKQSSGLTREQFFKKMKHTKTASQAILDVFFGISELAIVPRFVFDLTVELNPAIKQQLVIIHQSKETFFPVLIFNFNSRHPPFIKKMVNNNLTTLDDKARGKQILDMFNIRSIKPINFDQLQSMRLLFQQYTLLLK